MDIHSQIIMISSVLGAIETILLFTALIFKPARIVIKNTFNKFIREPDERNKTQIEQIISKQGKIEKQLKRIMEGVNDRKASADKVDVAILHHLILSECNRYLKLKKITITQHEDLKDLMDVYQELGGNGTAEEAFRKVSKLMQVDEND